MIDHVTHAQRLHADQIATSVTGPIEQLRNRIFSSYDRCSTVASTSSLDPGWTFGALLQHAMHAALTVPRQQHGLARPLEPTWSHAYVASAFDTDRKTGLTAVATG